HRERDGLATAETEARDAAPLAPRSKRVEDRDDETRAGRADGMAERDRTAVHVELGLRDSELAAHALDATERLVHLEEIDIADRPARFFEAARDRATRRGEEQFGLVRVLALRDDARHRLRAQLTRAIRGRDDDRGPAVVELRGVAGGDRAALFERRLQLREALEGRLARRLVLVDHGDRALAPGHLDADELGVERAVLLRGECLLVRRCREAVLILAREPALLRDELAAKTHVPVAICVHQAVGEIRVLEVVFTEREAGAEAAHEVRRVRHALHTAGDDDARFARFDLRRREHYRLESRAANLVHGRARHAVRDPCADRGLTRGGLADACLDDVAHEDLVDLIDLDPGTLERAPDRDRSELGRAERREHTEERADPRPPAADDDG